MIADAPGHRATWFYVADREARYQSLALDATIKAVKIEKSEVIDRVVELRARTVVRDLTLLPDRSSAIKTAWNYPILRTLLPGEEVKVMIASKPGCDGGADLAARPGPPVIWCANDFGAS